MVYILAFYYYFKIIKLTSSTFKDAAGIYYEDRYVPVIESITNIVFSIVFIKIFGLAGVFLGTIFSNMILHIYSYPKYVYKKLFNKSYKKYYIDLLLNVVNASVSLIICSYICNVTKNSNTYIEFGKNFVVSTIIVTLQFILIYKNKEEFKYYIKSFKKFFKKFRHKEKGEQKHEQN